MGDAGDAYFNAETKEIFTRYDSEFGLELTGRLAIV